MLRKKIEEVSFKIFLKVVCDWVSLCERGRSFDSRGPQTLKAVSPAARHRWGDGTDRSIYHQWQTTQLSEVQRATSWMGTRHFTWLSGQCRGLWKWCSTCLAVNGGLSVQVWYDSYFFDFVANLAADDVCRMSWERHLFIKGHTQVTYSLAWK